MQITPVQRIQGRGLFSPVGGQEVLTRGVVVGATRRGYFIQDPDGDVHGRGSHGLFVFERKRRPPVGSLVEVAGRVVDYQPSEGARPSTQLVEESTRVVAESGPRIEPVWLTADRVLVEHGQLTALLNRLEGMLVGIEADATFVAPSNPFGDYVVLPPGGDVTRTAHGGVLIDPRQPERWLPGFRVLDYAEAPSVNVGARLLEPVLGPLNFRADSFQMAASGPVRVRSSAVEPSATKLRGGDGAMTVLTLNGFNLDAHREDPERVNDPRRDVDDDVGDGRFAALGRAIVHDAAAPGIVALQEMQDNDGAELSDVVSAERTYQRLVQAVQRAGGPAYRWLDIPPQPDADGGQPGANIRNAFLYDPRRVELVAGSLQRLGTRAPEFVDSRKPLTARFRRVRGGGELELVNVHLASKRHQLGLFAPERPGFDPRLELRVRQAELLGRHLAPLHAEGIDYYVTGDFNDFEFSDTLRALAGEHSTNLVERVPEALRFDYNHRGLSEALMHGIVSDRQFEEGRAAYEILHANALEGIQPGRKGEKPSDHAYVIARLE